MSKWAAWLASACVALGVITFLLWIATFRFAVPLVYPPPHPPDYALQAAIAVGGAFATLVGFAVFGIRAAHADQRRARVVMVNCLSMVGIGLVAAILAFTIPA